MIGPLLYLSYYKEQNTSPDATFQRFFLHFRTDFNLPDQISLVNVPWKSWLNSKYVTFWLLGVFYDG